MSDTPTITESKTGEPVSVSAPQVAGKGMANQNRQHGVAILMVLVCLAVLLPFTASFNYSAKVDLQSSVNNADEVRARNLQRGALQLSVMMFELQRLVFNQKQFREYVGNMDITQVAPYLMSIFGSQDGGEGLGDLIGIDTSALSELAIEDGNFEVRLEAESGKVNINCLATNGSGREKSRERTVEVLEAMMMPSLYDPLFDEDKSDGQRYTREMVLRAMIDYLDADNQKFDLVRLKSQGSPEEYRYTQLFDPYQARNARLDSVDELHLVEGIDDDWMAAFGNELGVYGGCKVNLNFASAEQIALVIRHSVKEDDKEFTEGENFLTMTLPLANFIVQSREFNLFKDLSAFVDMAKEPDRFVNPMTFFGQAEEDTSNLPKVPRGIQLNLKGGTKDSETWGGVQDLATIAPERVYRVEIVTEVGSARKRVTAIYDLQFARSQSAGKGAWMYFRED